MICTLNDQVVPCNQAPQIFWIMPLIMFSLMIVGVVFWIMMLIDAIKYQKEDKTMWVVVICLTQILGAIIYYFVAKRKRVIGRKKVA